MMSKIMQGIQLEQYKELFDTETNCILDKYLDKNQCGVCYTHFDE